MLKNIKFEKSSIKGVEIKRCSYSKQAYKEHVHEELSIGYIEKGSTIVGFKGTDYKFSENEGIIIPPYVSHICRPHNIDHWQFIMIYIDKSFYDEKLVDFVPRKLSKTELETFKKLIKLFSEEHFAFETEDLLIDFLIKFGKEKKEIIRKSEEDKEIIKVHEYIKSNFLNKISLDELQDVFKMNKFSMIRVFKSTYNTTPSAFQLQLKVACSKKMLGNGAGIIDAGNESGFYDQAHFTREFKKANGITPLQYQNDILK